MDENLDGCKCSPILGIVIMVIIAILILLSLGKPANADEIDR